MKKAFLFAAMLAIAASCSVSEIDSIKGTTAPEITASYENNGTKTTITTDEEGVGTIWWKPADEINVFYGTLSTHYTSKNTENATTVAFGTTDIIGATESASENIWGLYPYNENAVCDGESVTTTIPAVQQAIAGSFDDDIFTSLAHSTSTVMTFYNVLGGIKFSLSRDDIQTITFKGNNDEDIAGKVKLEMDANGKPVAEITEGEKTITLTPKEGTTFAKNTNYYLVMLPIVLSNGFTMTFETETAIGTFEYTTKSIEIKRSVFSKKENIDSYATFDLKGDPNLQKPLTIKSNGSTTVALAYMYSPTYEINLEYRIGAGDWTTYTVCDISDYSNGKASASIIALSDGDELQFRAGSGGNEKFSTYHSYYLFEIGGTGTVSASGNVMSILDASMQRNTLPDYAFRFLFYGCTKLVEASGLKLPVMELSYNCYEEMFGSTGLITPPELPATKMEGFCYYGMFDSCFSLIEAPELPATELAMDCYFGMFAYCRNLISAPMELPATELASSCYEDMFMECESLETAPILPAINLASNCYSNMFSGCISLTTAPSLPATSMAVSCYSSMFSNCTSLTTPPSLPATTLANSCYYSMFKGCNSLTTAPELPAITLASGCYSSMFNGCSNLNYIKALFMTAPSSSYTDNWVTGVALIGTFIKNTEATWDVTGEDGIPSNWIIEKCYPEYVDLGLPSGILWATCNLGASKPEYSGYYFLWGDITGYNPINLEDDSDSDDYYCEWKEIGSNRILDALPTGTRALPFSGNIPVSEAYDAAMSIKGDGWRIPTKEDFEELIDPNNTIIEYVGSGRFSSGIRITSRKNGNSIFLPEAGYGVSQYLGYLGGYYWSSTKESYYRIFLNIDGRDLTFGRWSPSYSEEAFPIRPVIEY